MVHVGALPNSPFSIPYSPEFSALNGTASWHIKTNGRGMRAHEDWRRLTMAAIRIFLLALGLLILIGAGYGTYVIRHGFSARDQPTGIETFIAKMMRRLAVPLRAKSISNGLPAT